MRGTSLNPRHRWAHLYPDRVNYQSRQVMLNLNLNRRARICKEFPPQLGNTILPQAPLQRQYKYNDLQATKFPTTLTSTSPEPTTTTKNKTKTKKTTT
jgi:hypothetical protein